MAINPNEINIKNIVELIQSSSIKDNDLLVIGQGIYARKSTVLELYNKFGVPSILTSLNSLQFQINQLNNTVGNSVLYSPQVKTPQQKADARNNLDVYSKTETQTVVNTAIINLGNVVNSVNGVNVDNTDPKNPIVAEFRPIADYNNDMLNKADIDGNLTTGGVWFQDQVLSDRFANYKQVWTALTNNTIEWGNVELDKHIFLVDDIDGLKIKVGGTDGTIWNTLNLTNVSQLNNDAGYLQANDLDGFIYDVVYNSSAHTITFYQQNEPNIVVDLPIEQLIKGVQLVGNDLVFTFEDGSTVTVPLNTLLVGVVKSVNGLTPNSQGEIVLNITDIPNLSSELANKLDIRMAGLVSNLTQPEKDAILSKLGVVNNIVQVLGLSGNTITLSNGGGSVSLNIANIGGLQTALDLKANVNGNNLTNIANWQSVLGITTALNLNLQQVANNGASTTHALDIQTTTYAGGSIYNDANFNFLTKGSAALKVLTGGILASDNYADASLIPTNGIYSKGTIATASHGTSADWNAKLGVGDNISLLNNDAGYITSTVGLNYFPRNYNNTLVDANTATDGILTGFQWQNVPINTIATLTTKVYSPDWIRQTFQVINGTGLIWIRDRHSGTTWGNWILLATQDWTINNFVQNSQLGNYALLSQVYTQSQALALFVGLNGVQTIADTKTFTSSPIVPNATLSGHAVNKSQLDALASSIPTVGNGQLSFTAPAGLAISGTFNANQSGNTTIPITWQSGYQGFTTAESNKLAGIQAGATVPNNGTFTVQGTGALTGNGSTSANALANTSATLDLTTATKIDINAGKNASTQVNKLFGSISRYYKLFNMTGGGFVNANQQVITQIFTTSGNQTINISDHTLDGADLKIYGATGGVTTVNINAVNLVGSALTTINLEGNGLSFHWSADLNAWVQYFN